MIKSGVFRNNQTGELYHVVELKSVGKGHRVSLYKDVKDFDFYDTSKVVASYFFKTKEYTLGDTNLIKKYFEFESQLNSFTGAMANETKFEDGKIVTYDVKENRLLGLRKELQLHNGILAQEILQSKEFTRTFNIDDYNDTDSIIVSPSNLQDYKVSTIVKGDLLGAVTGDVDYYSLSHLKNTYDLDHIEDYDYVVVESLEQAKQRLYQWRDSSAKLKSFDIETTGLDVGVYGEDRITGVVISYDWDDINTFENSTYFPFRQKNFKYNLPIEFLYEIADTINNQPEDVSILAHNGVMERNGFMRDGKKVRVDKDTMVLSQLIDTKQQRGLHALKGRAEEATGLFWLELSHIFVNKNIAFDILPKDIVKYYACPDAPNTIKVYKYLIKKLPKTENYVFENNNKLCEAKAIQEYYGIRLDFDGLKKRLDFDIEVIKVLSALFKEIHKTAKNINSNDVMRDVLYNQLKAPVLVYTNKKKPSTSVDAINAIVEKSHIDIKEGDRIPKDIVVNGEVILEGKKLASNLYPSLVIYQKYKLFTKEKSSLDRKFKKSRKDRYMLRINGQGAASGRQTSDAHQDGNVAKSFAVADTPDHTLVSCDYSQVELRIMAHVIRDQRLVDMMKNPFIDIHRAFLNVITGKPIHMISSIDRAKGKRVNFGVVYGLSGYGLARDRYGVRYTQEQLRECQKDIIDFYNSIPKLKRIKEKWKKQIRSEGYIETEFGYRRVMYNATNPNLSEKELAKVYLAGLNTPIQGFGAELMKMAENNYIEYIKKKGWDKTVEYNGGQFPLVRLMLSIHDEVLLSCHNSIPKEEIIKMCKICQEIEVEGAPPFFAVPTFIDNWLQGKSDEYEMSVSLRDDILREWERGNSIIDWSDYVGSVKKYKLKQIEDYMASMIAKYRDKDELTKHIDHPEFTHTLISIYVKKDEVYKHTHMECIELAVERYLSNVVVSEVIKAMSEKAEDDSIRDNYDSDITEFIEYDDEGNYIVPEVDEVEIDDDEYKYDVQEVDNYINKNGLGVIYTMNECIIDVSSLKDIAIMKLFHKELSKKFKDNGQYRVVYMRGSDTMTTDFRIDFDRKELESLISHYVSLSSLQQTASN